jgi:dihydrofolate reductase
MISAIVCADSNWGIGHNGDLLVRIPEDMKFFKEKTMNNVVVMGRKTWESIGEKPLSNRCNVVITSKYNGVHPYTDCILDTNTSVIFMPIEAFYHWHDWLAKIGNGMYIIGGGKIYEELLHLCDNIYITRLDNTYQDADTYFPNIDILPEWEIESESEMKEYNDIKYQFYTYKRN